MPTDQLDLFGETAMPPCALRVGRRVHLPMTARAQAEEMRRQGASVAAIGGALGVAEATARTRLRAELERACPGGLKPGRPRWCPSADNRARVEQLASNGVRTGRIAEELGVSKPTLRLHCGAELARGRALRAASPQREEQP